MDQAVRNRLPAWVALYLVLGLGWMGFARWVVPPYLAAEHPGPAVAVLKRFLHVPPVAFLHPDLFARWREFSGSVLIAMAMHLAIVALLGRYDRAAAGGGRASRMTGLVEGALALAFLAVAILAPIRQDYFFYMEMWHHVRQGQDPWFIVWGADGAAPLNAYGPLFNPIAALAWINPVAPRLVFSLVYLVFAIAMSRGFADGRPPSVARALGLLVLFWNPFVWIEVAFYGHFDLLVGLACLGSVRAWAARRDVRAGAYLAAGVLLKYLPIVLLPFLALERDSPRLRPRFLASAVGLIAAGLGLSVLIWGTATFRPLEYAATRPATALSIFRFLYSRYSPLLWLNISVKYHDLSIPAQLLALGLTWRWSRVRRPDVAASALVAVLAFVLLYRVGYPQYQMVPYVLAAGWLLGDWDRPRARILPAVAMALYFGWITAFDVIYVLSDAWGLEFGSAWLGDVGGLPTFLLGSALVACIVIAATPRPADPAPDALDPR